MSSYKKLQKSFVSWKYFNKGIYVISISITIVIYREYKILSN